MREWSLILAQEETGTENPAGVSEQSETTTGSQDSGAEGQLVETEQAPRGFLDGPMPMIIMLMVVMWFFLIRGPQKKQKKHREMLSAIEKNARVQTIGGILGTVVEVRDQEVVIKVDESNNTKMHFARSAIGKVITETEA